MNKEDMTLEALAKQGEAIAQQGELLGQINGRLDRLEATQTQQGEQLTRLDKKIGELSETVNELDERSLRTATLPENDIAPKVQLLLDGHTHLVDTLVPKKRVEKVEEIDEERLFVLESMVKSNAERITALEKAQ